MSWVPRPRMAWIAGVVLLTASLIGAGKVMNGSHPEAGPVDSDKPVSRGGGVICSGVIDALDGAQPLSPSVPGEVAEVLVKDGQAVRKGDPLLRLDDTLAKMKLAQAEAGVAAAEGALTKATDGLAVADLVHRQQELAIKAAKTKLADAKERLAKGEQLLKDENLGADAVKAGRKAVDLLEQAVEAEELKLKEIDARKPTGEAAQAKANLAAAKALRDMAKYGVQKCVLTAPADGEVLRVMVAVGYTFGPESKIPAFRFGAGPRVVRAEVDQEFADRVREGQVAVIHDDTNTTRTWRGHVTRVAGSFLPKRDALGLPDAFAIGQPRMLECVIAFDEGQTPPATGRRVRLHLNGD